jgi:hypothetical protein
MLKFCCCRATQRAQIDALQTSIGATKSGGIGFDIDHLLLLLLLLLSANDARLFDFGV